MARKVETKKAKKKAPVQRAVDHAVVSAVSPWFFSANWTHLLVNDDWMRMLLVNEYSTNEQLGWGDAFRGLEGVNAPISLIMRKLDRGTLRRQLSRTANEAAWTADDINSSVFEQWEKDFEAAQAVDAADKIIRTNATMFETYLYVGLRAKDQAALEEVTESAETRIRGLGKESTTFVANQDKMFFAGSPFMCRDEYSENVCNWSMPSTTIAEGLFNQERGICDPSGIPLGTDGSQGKIRIDPTITSITRPNRNVFIAAGSGSGKTHLIRRFVTYYRALYDFKVIINDVDDEYGAQVRALGGVSVNFNRNSGMLLSPFRPRNVGSESDWEEAADAADPEDILRAREETEDAKVLSTHLPFLVTFLSTAFSISEAASDLLKIACQLTYNRYGIADGMTFREYEASGLKYPSMVDLYEMVKEMQKVPGMEQHKAQLSSFELKFQPAAVGFDRHIWEEKGLEMPDAGLVRINLQSLSDDPAMQAAQYYNLFTWEWAQVRSNRYADRTVVIVSDEVHKVVNRSNPKAAFMFKDMVQRIRKYGAFMVTSTQMITDLLDKEIRTAGEGIINNSAIQFFGKTDGDEKSPESNNLKETQAQLSATSEVMTELKGAPRGKFIARIGTDKQSWLYVDPPTEWEKGLFGAGSGR